MKTSVCITVYNEEKSISELIKALLSQSKKPGEIAIVDGGSSDKTVELIRHWQKKDKKVRLLVRRCSRSEGRNLSIELARNNVIAVTDAGCVPKKDWLEKLVLPFKNKKVEMVAGFYEMKGDKPIQRAFSVFLGVHKKDFDTSFLPSTRSVAFKKKLWGEIGGFPESLDDTAEDTIFNIKAANYGVKMAHTKDAIVEWGVPETIKEGINKMYLYAKGDAKTKVWKHPTKGLASHNMKVLSILFRYLLGLMVLLLSYKYPHLLYAVIGMIFIYLFWIFRKVYVKTQDIYAAFWGIVIQFLSDLIVVKGFLSGINKNNNINNDE